MTHARTEPHVPLSAVHVPALDGLRGLAILLVMLTHFADEGDITSLSSADDWVIEILAFGWIGVDLFFVLSGFLITGILLDSSRGAHFFRNFYIRRVLRIFPLYYGFLALWLGVLPFFYTWPEEVAPLPVSSLWAWGYLTNVAQALYEDWSAAPPYASHFWSLAIEEQFYLVWPAVVFLLSRRKLTVVCIVLLAIGPITRISLVLQERFIAAYFLTPARMDTLAMGALIALFVRHQQGLRPPRYMLPLCTIVASAVFVALEWTPLPGPYEDVPSYGFRHTVLACLFGALLVMVFNGRSTARFFSRSVLRFLGRYSYALYVFHFPVAYFIASYVLTVDAIPAFMGTRLLGLLIFSGVAGSVSIALALLSWHLYEKHFLKLKDRFTYRCAAVEEGSMYKKPSIALNAHFATGSAREGAIRGASRE